MPVPLSDPMPGAATVTLAELMAASGVGFGTSGARGLVSAMTDRVCYLYTRGFLSYLVGEGLLAPGGAVAIAGDFRPSSPRIMAAAAAAIADAGHRCVNCGTVPSPALAAYAFARGMPSLMVTGSHIPDDRNGIKFNRPDGEVLKADEAAMREVAVAAPAARFDEHGALCPPVTLPAVDPAAHDHYVRRYLDAFPAACLDGVTVLLYEHSTVAARALGEILAGLGATVLRRGHSERFMPVDTEAVRPEDVALAAAWARQERFDGIVSADGDGDRPLLGDERGEWLRGDVLGILVARHLGAATVVTPVSSNTALERCGAFAATHRTRIGSPYVIEGMLAARAAGGSPVVGYEANGGFLLMDDLDLDGRRLGALPTRDAALPALALLLAARRSGRTLSALAADLPRRYTASDRLKDFPAAVAASRLAALAAERAAIVREFPGLGAVSALDLTDGLRITFASGEVVHLRPSGNAPELRCYTEADDPARAAALNAACLRRLETWR